MSVRSQQQVSSYWEEQSYLRRMPCEACGGEIHYLKSQFLTTDPGNITVRLEGECEECKMSRALDFDITSIDPFSTTHVWTEAWPPPGGWPYPLAEQGLPSVSESGSVSTHIIAGRWAIIGGRSGSMGHTYLCNDRSDPGRLAIIKLPRSPEDHNALRREIGIYIRLCWEREETSRHVLSLLDVVATGVGTPWLVLEPILPGPQGMITVADWLKTKSVTLDLAKAWVSHLATALDHCSRLIEGFVHGDIKPDNLLIDVGWVLKLSDFGTSGDAQTPAIAGAALYRAPELWDGSTPSEKSDVYSFGCVAYELYTGHPPFLPSTREFDLLDLLEEAHRSHKAEQVESVPAVIFSCLAKLPSLRPTFAELAEHFQHSTTRSSLRRSVARERNWNDAAAAYISLGQLEAAFFYLKRLIDAGSPNPSVLLNLATAASKGELRELAEGAFKACADLLGEHSALLANLATHRYRYGDPTSAIELAERALRLNPLEIGALMILSVIFNDNGNHEEALRRIEEAKSVDPRHPTILYQLAYTYLKLQKCSKAREAFDRFTKISDNTELKEALFKLGVERCPGLFRTKKAM